MSKKAKKRNKTVKIQVKTKVPEPPLIQFEMWFILGWKDWFKWPFEWLKTRWNARKLRDHEIAE